MNRDMWGMEITLHHSFFDPQQHVISRSTLVIAKVVIQAQVRDLAGLQVFDDLVGPLAADPPLRSWAEVV